MTESALRPLANFTIHLPFGDATRFLVDKNEDGTLGFGYSATSIGPCDHAQLLLGADFRDYILEGFVKYRLQLKQSGSSSVLSVSAYGSKRDHAIVPALKHYLRSAGISDYEIALVDSKSSVK